MAKVAFDGTVIDQLDDLLDIGETESADAVRRQYAVRRVDETDDEVDTTSWHLDQVESVIGYPTEDDRGKAVASDGIITHVVKNKDGITANSQKITTLTSQVNDDISAAIQQEATTRASKDSSLAQDITNLESKFNSDVGTATSAAIQQEATTRASKDSSLAQDITNLESKFDNDVGDAALAAIQQEATTRASKDSSLSSDITTVQTNVNNNWSSIQTNATAIDGVQAQYTVKVDVNGYVSGYGLASSSNEDGDPYSRFYVRVDRFAVINPGDGKNAVARYPFIIQDGKSYMDEAMVNKLTFTKLVSGSGGIIAKDGKIQAKYIEADKLHVKYDLVVGDKPPTDADKTAGQSIDVLKDRNLGHIDDSSTRLATQRHYLSKGSGSQWISLGKLHLSHTGATARLTFQAGPGYNTNSNQVALTDILIRSGNNGGAPNLSQVVYINLGEKENVTEVKVKAHGGSTSKSNKDWDVYAKIASYAKGSFFITLENGSTFDWDGATTSDPGSESSKLAVGVGGHYIKPSNGTGLDGVPEGGTYKKPKGSGLYSGFPRWTTVHNDGGKPQNGADVTGSHTANDTKVGSGKAVRQKGADKTSSNTAKDTSKVAGRSATTVKNESRNGKDAHSKVWSWLSSHDSTKIDGGSIYTKNAFIVNAMIKNSAVTKAKIKDAAVDTLKIKGHAVTVPTTVTKTGSGTGKLLTLSGIQSLASENVYLLIMIGFQYLAQRSNTIIGGSGGSVTATAEFELKSSGSSIASGIVNEDRQVVAGNTSSQGTVYVTAKVQGSFSTQLMIKKNSLNSNLQLYINSGAATYSYISVVAAKR